MEIWQLARALNIKLNPLLMKLNETRNFGLKNQLDNSAGSVMDNIAEGFERDGNREFIQFLAISKGSLGETRSQLYRAFDKECLTKDMLGLLQNDCEYLAAKIANFMRYLKSTEFKGNKFK